VKILAHRFLWRRGSQPAEIPASIPIYCAQTRSTLVVVLRANARRSHSGPSTTANRQQEAAKQGAKWGRKIFTTGLRLAVFQTGRTTAPDQFDRFRPFQSLPLPSAGNPLQGSAQLFRSDGRKQVLHTLRGQNPIVNASRRGKRASRRSSTRDSCFGQ